MLSRAPQHLQGGTWAWAEAPGLREASATEAPAPGERSHVPEPRIQSPLGDYAEPVLRLLL